MTEYIVAIPKQEEESRLYYQADDLLKRARVYPSFPRKRLTAEWSVREIPEIGSFKIVQVRLDDIVGLVADGQATVGITCSDTVAEYKLGLKDWRDRQKEPQVLFKFGIGRSRLSIAAPIDSGIKSEDELAEGIRTGKFARPYRGVAQQFSGLTIATRYPKLTADYFYDIDRMLDSVDYMDFKLNNSFSGCIETAPTLGIADAISEIVDEGSLEDNGLKEVVSIFESEGVLITGSLPMSEDKNRFVNYFRNLLERTKR